MSDDSDDDFERIITNPPGVRRVIATMDVGHEGVNRLKHFGGELAESVPNYTRSPKEHSGGRYRRYSQEYGHGSRSGTVSASWPRIES